MKHWKYNKEDTGTILALDYVREDQNYHYGNGHKDWILINVICNNFIKKISSTIWTKNQPNAWEWRRREGIGFLLPCATKEILNCEKIRFFDFHINISFEHFLIHLDYFYRDACAYVSCDLPKDNRKVET